MFTITVNLFRWKWALFVLFGVGKGLSLGVVRQGDKARGESGVGK